jgi:hypothetical protein
VTRLLLGFVRSIVFVLKVRQPRLHLAKLSSPHSLVAESHSCMLESCTHATRGA